MASDDLVESVPTYDNRIHLFEKQICVSKLEANRIGEEMKELIDEKTFELFKELDNILKEVKKRREEKMKEIRDINKYVYSSFNQIFSDRIQSIEKEIEMEIPVVKLNWKVNALRDSINKMCLCNVQYAVPFTENPETPKSGLFHGDRVIAHLESDGKTFSIYGTILTTFEDRTGQMYHELYTDNPVNNFIREKEVMMRARRSAHDSNSLFVRIEQCVPDDRDERPFPLNLKFAGVRKERRKAIYSKYLVSNF